MSQTVGQRLTEARSKQGLSIEDVAHTTRIRPNTLREMESDDYSNFPNLTYAKSFLNMYSKHLQVDVSDFIREFGPANAGSLDVMSFLDPVNGSSSNSSVSTPALGATQASPAYSPLRSQSRGHPIFFIIIFLAVIGAGYSMYRVAKNTSGEDESTADTNATISSAGNSRPDPVGPPSPDSSATPPTDLPPSPFPAGSNKPDPDYRPSPVPSQPAPKTENGEPVIVRPAVLEDSSEPPEEDAPRAVPFRPEKPE